MKSLSALRAQLGAAAIDLSRHALRRMVERNISQVELMEAGASAEVLEQYPDDKYSPSALLLGFTAHGRPPHFQVS